MKIVPENKNVLQAEFYVFVAAEIDDYEGNDVNVEIIE